MLKFRSLPQLAAFVGVALAAAFFLGGCTDTETEFVQPGSGTVLFSFDHAVDGTPVTASDLQTSTTNFPYTNAAGNQYNVDHLIYMVSNFTLHKANGQTIGIEDSHARDGKNTGTRTYTWSGVPAGTYTGVSFTYGLDAKANPIGPPFGVIPWPTTWGGGSHYMEMNGHYLQSDGTTVEPHKTHTGRRKVTNSEGMPPGPDDVAYHHFFEVYYPVPAFEIKDGEIWEVVFTMNINGWYEDPVFDLETYFPLSTSGIMVHLPAQTLLMENGMKNAYDVAPTVTKK